MRTASQEYTPSHNRPKSEWRQRPAWHSGSILNQPVSTPARLAAEVPVPLAHVLGAITGSAAIGLFLLGLAGCAQPSFADAGSTAAPPSAKKSLAEALRADPRFTDFNQVVSFAGLTQELDDAGEVTVFAPTNAAFAPSDPNWRVNLAPDQRATGGAAIWRRQALVEGAFIVGNHPASEFAGKLQDVRSVGGAVFHVDGKVPGAVTITTGSRPATGIGFGNKQARVAHLQLSPIQTRNGLIYSVDAIIVANRS